MGHFDSLDTTLVVTKVIYNLTPNQNLPGTRDTVIYEAVPLGRGPSITLWLGLPLRSSQMCVLRLRYPLTYKPGYSVES